MTEEHGTVASSFRDPSGFVFLREGVLYRQVNRVYQQHFELLRDSGLYERLAHEHLLIPHTDLGLRYAVSDEAYTVIQPMRIPFISYPYEWCFSQLKDAALLTLAIQVKALEHGMSLKDSSPYNIQFIDGKPLLMDTLSFELHEEGRPWVAYRQFCQHFLAPLALMSRVDVRLHQLLRAYLDGLPLDLTSRLLPWRTRLSLGLLSHIHLHARAQARFAGRDISSTRGSVSRIALLGLLDSLRSTVDKLRWQPGGTAWHDYYDSIHYSSLAFGQKKHLVAEMLDMIAPPPASVWDLGANTGLFSRIASSRGIPTISFDIDPAAVEMNYLEARANRETKILPLLLDLTNPTGGMGWENEERLSLLRRGPVDAVLALALVHHLAISGNLPFTKIAHLLSRICRTLLIEFVPKSDSQVQRLLASREDIFDEYNEQTFRRAFGAHFSILHRQPLQDTDRSLYLMSVVSKS
jgi:hypothetical protein